MANYRDLRGKAKYQFLFLRAFLERNDKKTPPKMIFGGVFCNFA